MNPQLSKYLKYFVLMFLVYGIPMGALTILNFASIELYFILLFLALPLTNIIMSYKRAEFTWLHLLMMSVLPYSAFSLFTILIYGDYVWPMGLLMSASCLLGVLIRFIIKILKKNQ